MPTTTQTNPRNNADANGKQLQRKRRIALEDSDEEQEYYESLSNSSSSSSSPRPRGKRPRIPSSSSVREEKEESQRKLPQPALIPPPPAPSSSCKEKEELLRRATERARKGLPLISLFRIPSELRGLHLALGAQNWADYLVCMVKACKEQISEEEFKRESGAILRMSGGVGMTERVERLVKRGIVLPYLEEQGEKKEEVGL